MLYKYIFVQLLIVIFNILLGSSADCINSQVKTKIKPNWIIENRPAIDINFLSEGSYGGYYYLLLDIQENILKETIYCHYAIKLLNSDGVQNMSDISVDYDPNYQTLRFHEINRIRDGIVTNEMLNHKINIIQREPDMERFLYDGRLTAFVNLEDMREGDIIEYSYSLEGNNPMYKGSFFKNLKFEYSDPIKEIYRRIISPKKKQLYFNYLFEKIEPVIQEVNNDIIYVWHKKDVKSHIYDNNVPTWHNDNQRVEISTFKNWNGIVSLLLDNYQVSETELINLKRMTNKIFGQQNQDSLLIPIVRFVQDNIRYLGFESGLSAYKPTPPSKVMGSRYADCKAKSLLLCSLLKLYGIEAYPVLVNSNQIKTEKLVLPSPDVFNHVVVQIYYKNRVFYIDPTISNQGGSIENNYFPNYGYGLVLKEGTNDLIALTNNSLSETRIQNYFKMNEIGGTVSYKVITEYSGYFADDIRSSYKNKSNEETFKNYLKFYSNSYPYIRIAAPLKYNDDRNKNLFTVEEDYLIDSMWIPVEDTPRKLELSLAALVINSAVSIPASPERKMPYSVSFPSNYTEDIYIDLPEEWNITPKKTEIKDSVFSFSYSSAYKDKKIHLQYKYITFRDYQTSKSFKEFYSNHQKISDNLTFSLTYTTKAANPFKFSWIVACFYIIILIVSIIYSVKIFRNFNLQIYSSENREIGGWLILIAFGLIISTIKVANQLFFDTSFFDQRTWSVYLSPTNTNITLFVLICFEFMYNSVLLVYLILLQILFYKRRNSLPKLIIIFYATNVIFLILDTILAFTLSPDSYSLEQKNKSYLEIGQNLVAAIIWITYFVYSKRVKSTFTQVAILKTRVGLPQSELQN